jgi:hypothetical protein
VTVRIEVKGLKELQDRLRGAAPAVIAGAAQGGMDMMKHVIMPESQDECPVRIGILQGSEYVAEPVVDSRGITLVMGYSDPKAIFVEQMLDPTELGNPVHWTKAGSKPKFLEDPFFRHADEFPEAMAKGMRDALEALAK